MGTKTVELKELEGIFPGDLKRGIARGNALSAWDVKEILNFVCWGCALAQERGAQTQGTPGWVQHEVQKKKRDCESPVPPAGTCWGKNAPLQWLPGTCKGTRAPCCPP